MRRSKIVIALSLGLACALARAEDPRSSWEEPSLEAALARAKLVVRARVVATGPTTKLEVLAAIAGDAKVGEAIAIRDQDVPASTKLLAPLAVGDESILVLEPGKDGLATATPTFGRFAVRDGDVVASVRDSFVRVALPVAVYEAFLRNAHARAKGGSAEAAWIASCRATLAAIDPTKDFVAAHVALEGLAQGAEEKDTDLAARFVASPAQVRVSATRVLERARGPKAAAALLALAKSDADGAVRTTATLALARAKPTDDQVKELLALVPSADARAIMLHPTVDDPRTNELPSNLAALLETLRALGAAERATPLAIDLLAKDDGDTLVAACRHLELAKDVPVEAIVEKMRPADHPFSLPNLVIARTLTKLTGKELGADRDAWRKALKKG